MEAGAREGSGGVRDHAVESTYVDLDGKSHREQAEAKICRREREVPGEEGEEIKNQRRKVIGVESEDRIA